MNSNIINSNIMNSNNIMDTNNIKQIRDLPFEKRSETVKELNNRFPDRIPVVITDEHKTIKPLRLLVSPELLIMNILVIIRKRVFLNKEEAIYLFATIYKNKQDSKVKKLILCNSTDSISSVYNTYKDEDGLIYLTYCKENVFG